ncbi:hypothetical protein U1Q18_017415 [Sarracenia purpurea var. burkii]
MRVVADNTCGGARQHEDRAMTAMREFLRLNLLRFSKELDLGAAMDWLDAASLFLNTIRIVEDDLRVGTIGEYEWAIGGSELQEIEVEWF